MKGIRTYMSGRVPVCDARVTEHVPDAGVEQLAGGVARTKTESFGFHVKKEDLFVCLFVCLNALTRDSPGQ